jgi:NADH-quinone oxidoreductase subunit G
MPKLKIDDKEIEVQDGMTVLQACEQAGTEIPRFCYHERLAIAGNCRMCLVEMEKSPKPIASCAMPAAEGMVIRTNTPLVKKAREGVLEFLLINHPLDCPICDQGGECDLQDQVMAYGAGENRFRENKRAIKDKDFGPLIKSYMTRCIHCTRCIRFSEDIAGISELGAVYRGEDMEVGTYIEKALSSELSGNIIDLCPVGALTSKPYSFKARSWELKSTDSIDVLDAVGSNIRVDVRGLEVMRILPRLNESINEEWISDKTRFAYDGLKLQRLDRPLIKKNNRFEEVSWDEALKAINKELSKLSGKEIAAIAGDLTDVESMFILKNIMHKLGSDNIDCRQEGEKLYPDNRSSYIFNTTIQGIEKADLCLLIGTNPRKEAPMINARIRKTYLKNDLPVYTIGIDENYDLTYPIKNLGNDPNILNDILNGEHPIAKEIKKAKYPMLILGASATKRDDGDTIISLCQKIADNLMNKENWIGFNVLHKSAARVGGLDIGFVPKSNKDITTILNEVEKSNIKFVYLLAADEIDTAKLQNSFVVYQGHHGDKGANCADIILPGAAYTEKNATYVNTEGKIQKTKRAVFAPGQALEDWQILINLSNHLKLNFRYQTLSEVRDEIAKELPIFRNQETIIPAEWKVSLCKKQLNKDDIHTEKFNFYMTDPISRASKTMAECSHSFNKKEVA